MDAARVSMKAKGVLSEQDAEDASAEHGGGPQPTHRRHRQLQRQARSSQVGRLSVPFIVGEMQLSVCKM